MKIKIKSFSCDNKLLYEQIFESYEWYEEDIPCIDSANFRKKYHIRKSRIIYFHNNEDKIFYEKIFTIYYDENGLFEKEVQERELGN